MVRGYSMRHDEANNVPLSESDRKALTDLAFASIRHGLEEGGSLPFQAGGETSQSLLAPGACFVTLKINGKLRGCIGSLEARRPLAEDVCANAHAAAFQDPRFTPVARDELANLELSISVLTPAQPLIFDTEQDLIEKLQPGVDGLILTDGGRRGTFLPSVWKQLPQATDFLRHLKLKAGLPADHWSDTVSIERYTTISW